MSRTQIALKSETERRARERAADLGISLAEYVRGLVRHDLETPTAAADISCLFNLGKSGDSDIAANKDAMLAEAFEADFDRSGKLATSSEIAANAC